MNYTISLQGLRFFAYHGVLPSERRQGQAFYVDLDLECAGPLPTDDDLSATVDYAAVYEAVRQVAQSGPYQLIETLAGRIGDEVLARFPQVEALQIAVHKPQAPLPGPVADVVVTFHRRRVPQ